MKIFVCDDDPDMQFLLSYLLKKAGHDAVVIPDKQSLFGHHPEKMDLILMDYHFGRDNGLEVLNDYDYTCPVILITGIGNLKLSEKHTELGIIDVIHKPFNPEYIITYFSSLSLP